MLTYSLNYKIYRKLYFILCYRNPNPEGKEFTWDRVNGDSKELNYLYIEDTNNIKMKFDEDLGKRRFWDSLPIKENQFNVDDKIVKTSHTEL